MPRWTRRELLKTGLAASAGAVTAKSLSLPAVAEKDVLSYSQVAENFNPAVVLRERLLLDFGWRFHFGHSSDPAKDFGYGERRRELTFAKSGAFPPVTRLKFDDSDWKSVDLPHD